MADWGQFPDGQLLNSAGKWTQKSKGKNRVHLIDEITHETHKFFFSSYQGFFFARVNMIHAFLITHPSIPSRVTLRGAFCAFTVNKREGLRGLECK